MRCYITDRHQAGGIGALRRLVRRALEKGIEMIQIREKDWSARELAAFSSEVMAMPNPHRTLIIVNSRVDVALACGAHGVHLPAGSVAPAKLRPLLPERFVIGVSCHSREEILRAMGEDADYVFIGPVFKPLSKEDSRTPLGIEGLREAVKGVPIPSFALGGITPDSIPLCAQAGAPSVAGISLFQKQILAD